MGGKYSVRASKEANQDLQDIMDWYDEQRSGLGLDFFDEFENLGWRLSDNPYLYQEHLLFVRRATVNKFPYHVFYAVDDVAAEVEIIAILHQSRDPEALRRRINLP